VGNDEAIYSFAVDKILETGDWLTPRTSPRIDIAFLEKPPLKFWIVAAPIRFGLLPQNEFGLRFWDAAMGSAAFLYVFALGVRLAGPVCGLVAGLLLFVHAPLVFDHGLRSNNMEAPLVLAYCGGIYHYIGWASAAGDRRRATAHVAAIAGFFVLGFMTKFVAVVFMPMVLIAVALIVAEDRVRLWRERRVWMAATAAIVVVTIPWFIYQWRQFGSDIWEIMLSAHVYMRFTSYLDPSHLQPWHFYFSSLYDELRRAQSAALALPGAALLIVATALGPRRQRLLVVVWFLLPVTIISFGSSKIYHYLYPFLPPVALAGGYLAQQILGVVPRWLGRPADRIDGSLPSLLSRRAPWLTRPAVRGLLLALAVAAVAIAVATLIQGGVDLRVGGVRILRNASSIRPLVYAAFLAALAGQLRLGAYVAAPLAVLWLLPLTPYAETLREIAVERHPLRTTRDCLLTLKAQRPAAEWPGVYADASEDEVLHFHHYYFDPVGPWERPEQSSDAALFARLFVPARQMPIIVGEGRYQRLIRRIQQHDAALFDEVARAQSLPRATAENLARHTSTPMLPMRDVLLVLPGRFGVCGR
jgi:hypothetical protein